MEPSAFDALTESFARRLEGDPRVVGLVLLGSTAGGADRWSDHDLFVVTVPGVQEELRTDVSWLPSGVEPVLVLRDTAHGLKVLSRDGHLVELAVFDLVELGVARVNRYRVAFDRDGSVTSRMRELEQAGGGAVAPDPDHLLGQVVTCALVGAQRHRRGETLSGAHLVGLALRHLLALLAATVPDPEGVLDDLDPSRRFEQAQPALGAELAELLRRAPDACALGLLDVAERVVAPERPDLGWKALGVARAHLLRD